jgi:hypothetical protein
MSKGYEYCTEEPLLSPYESCLMQILLFIADIHIVFGRLDQCLRDIEHVDRFVAIGEARRNSTGQQPRPQSEIRIWSMGLRAACASDPAAEVEPCSEASVALAWSFWQTADAMICRLADRSEDLRRVVLAGMARWEMEVCKLSFLVSPSLFSESVSRFNSRYDADLSASPPRPEAGRGNRTAWFWDLEVWKWLHMPERPAQALELCMSEREAAMRLTFGSLSSAGLKRYWQRQAQAA